MQDSLFKYEIYALEKQIISLEIKNDFIKCIIYNFNDDILSKIPKYQKHNQKTSSTLYCKLLEKSCSSIFLPENG